MKIKTEELRKFLSAAGNISPNPLHLYLDSIMIECIGNEIVFTKTNNNIWCRYSYVCQPSMPEKFLITERMLKGIAETSGEYEFTIDESVDGIHVRIIDGDGIIKSKKQELSQFPVMQQAAGEKIKIDQNTVQHLRTAGKFISTAPLKTNASFVNVSGDGIFAFNLMVAYYYKATGLPVMLLDHEPLNVMRTTDDVLYWTSGNFDFFQFDGFTFAFIKAALKLLPFAPMVILSPISSFSIKKIDLINFCTLAMSVKQKDYSIAKLFSRPESNNILNIKFVDARYDIDIDKNYQIESAEPVNEFTFNIDALFTMLKNIPYETLILSLTVGGHYYVTSAEDESYKSIICRLEA